MEIREGLFVITRNYIDHVIIIFSWDMQGKYCMPKKRSVLTDYHDKKACIISMIGAFKPN